MTGLIPLFKKEIKEQYRTHRLLIVGGVFLFFGLTTPLTLKYLPEIIRLAGEQIPLEIPPPTAAQSLAEYASTIGQLGILIAVLIAMGSVAGELRLGTAIITLSKPVSRAAFIISKLMAMSITFLVSLVIASLFCFGYTVWLIGPADTGAFIGLNLLLALFLVFCLAVTLLFSSLFRNSLAAGGVAIAVLIGQAAFSAIPRIGDYFPTRLLSWGTGMLNGNTDTYWWALGITVIAVVLCLYLAQRILNTKEQ
jgi:ABC-2 type transport system permease protein